MGNLLTNRQIKNQDFMNILWGRSTSHIIDDYIVGDYNYNRSSFRYTNSEF